MSYFCEAPFSIRCAEIATHVAVSVSASRANEFSQQEAGQPFAFVYQWTSSSWQLFTEQHPSTDNVECREINTEEIVSALPLLKHFHPQLDQAILARAMGKGYQVFGLWSNHQLLSIATWIRYPHLKNGMCVWLQDGMALPTKGYKEIASSLLREVMNACFGSGSPTVTVHAKVSNRRIRRFYEAVGGQYIANAYKWR
jgi:hypothetical protein